MQKENTIDLTQVGPEEIRKVKSDLEIGKNRKESVRTLLSWFGFQRRGVWVSNTINSILKTHQIETDPDFNEGWVDDFIEFKVSSPEEVDPGTELCKFDAHPFVPEIGALNSAKRSVISVCRDDCISKAISLMLMNDFSQLPVLQNSRHLDGIISWKSIGSYYYKNGSQPDFVRDCIETIVEIVDSNMHLSAAIQKIVENEFVLVKGKDNSIQGIVTNSDVTEQYREISQAFLFVGEIENFIRSILNGKFTQKQLREATDPSIPNREIFSISDLSFGEYVRIFQHPELWSILGLHLDRSVIADRLETIRQIRNQIMHFHRDGISEDDIVILKETADFFRNIIPETKLPK